MKKIFTILTLSLVLTGVFKAWGQSNLSIICEASLLPSPSWGSAMYPDTLFPRITPPSGEVMMFNKKYFSFGWEQPAGNLTSTNVTYGLFHFNGFSDIGIDSGIIMATA